MKAIKLLLILSLIGVAVGYAATVTFTETYYTNTTAFGGATPKTFWFPDSMNVLTAQVRFICVLGTNFVSVAPRAALYEYYDETTQKTLTPYTTKVLTMAGANGNRTQTWSFVPGIVYPTIGQEKNAEYGYLVKVYSALAARSTTNATCSMRMRVIAITSD